MGRKLLIVEDDAETRDYIAKGFVEQGYTVETASTGRDGLYHATDISFDALILDRMLPEIDGLSIVKSVRAAGISTPILLLTALSAVDERVRGLKSGADDYLIKPFSFAELHARVEALLRRPQDQSDGQTLTCGDVVMDLEKRKVFRGTRQLVLTPREFQILEFFLRRLNRVITRTMLLEGVWDYSFDPQTNVIDVHISKLRRELESDGEAPVLHTVRGAGYMLSEPEDT